MRIFKKTIAALKMIILKNEKHFIITKLREKIIFEKIRKILESGFFPESGFFRIFFHPKPGQFHVDSGNLNFMKICLELAAQP